MRPTNVATLLAIAVAAFTLSGCSIFRDNPTPGDWNSDCFRDGQRPTRIWDWRYQALPTEVRTAYCWNFTADNEYDVGYPEQRDWLKMRGGFVFGAFNNHSNYCGPAIRYRPDLGAWEIAPYVHHSGNTYRADQNPSPLTGPMPIAQFNSGDLIEVHCNLIENPANNYYAVAMTVITPEDGFYYEHPFGADEFRRKIRETNSYHGGTTGAQGYTCWHWRLLDRS